MPIYLVDTSVWIDYLQDRDAPQVRFLDGLLANPLATGITDLVFMEVLQGARDQRNFDNLFEYFGGQHFFRCDDPIASHAAAARIYFDCRRKGITIRSAADCLIAQCALEHDLTLFHHDRDFKAMAGVVKRLRQKHFLSASD